MTHKINFEMQNVEKSIKQLEGERDLTDLQTQESVTLKARYHALFISKAENKTITNILRTRGYKRNTISWIQKEPNGDIIIDPVLMK